MKGLRISPSLSLPLDAVTSTLVVYGGKGMGKTNLGSVIAEEMTASGLRWAWLDPLGVSWGLRHSADGKGPGVECLILGGIHGDVPIDPTGGAAVADIVVDEPHNVLVDFSRRPNGEMWSKGERIRFVTDYALRLFQRQGEIVDGKRRIPLLQVLDEAARYIPQVMGRGDDQIAQCVGAWEQIVEEGRNVGLGVLLLTQRSARMAKSVSELADAMFAFRTVGPNSLDAILDWLGEHVEKGRLKELAEKVRSLPRGEALLVSPGWLKVEQAIKVRLRLTFDSSSTPDPDKQARVAKGPGAKPDLDAIRKRMSATIERAKAEDPRELRKTIAELRKQLNDQRNAKDSWKQSAANAMAAKEKRVEVPILKDAQVKRLEAAVDRLRDASTTLLKAHTHQVDQLSQRMQVVVNEAGMLRESIEKHTKARGSAADPRAQAEPARTPALPAVPGRGRGPSATPPPVRSADGDGRVTGPEQRILDAIAWLETLGQSHPEQTAVAFLAGYTVGGGAFNNPRGSLRAKGLIGYRSDRLHLTDAGRALANAPGEALTAEEIQARVMDRLPGPETKLLRALIAAYPEPLANDELARRAGYEPGGGAFNNPRGRLRSLGLVEYPASGQVVAKPVLFLEGDS